MVIISQCIWLSNHHVVHFKYISILFANYTSVKLVPGVEGWGGRKEQRKKLERLGFNLEIVSDRPVVFTTSLYHPACQLPEIGGQGRSASDLPKKQFQGVNSRNISF